MRSKRSKTYAGFAALTTVLTVSAGVATAAPYYLQANQSSPTTFSSLTVWFDQSSGGGNNPATFNGHDLYQNDFVMRSPTSGTLGNASTVWHLDDNFGNRGTLTMSGKVIAEADGATNFLAGATSVKLTAGTYQADGNTQVSVSDASGRTQEFAITTLTGAGNFNLLSNSYSTSMKFGATNAGDYTGTISVAGTQVNTIEFTNDLVTDGAFTVALTGRVNLHQNVTFNAVTLAGTPLEAGTYSFSQLNASFDTLFVEGGSGSITVVPEPGAATLALAGIAALAVTGRRRIQRSDIH